MLIICITNTKFEATLTKLFANPFSVKNDQGNGCDHCSTYKDQFQFQYNLKWPLDGVKIEI